MTFARAPVAGQDPGKRSSAETCLAIAAGKKKQERRSRKRGKGRGGELCKLSEAFLPYGAVNVWRAFLAWGEPH